MKKLLLIAVVASMIPMSLMAQSNAKTTTDRKAQRNAEHDLKWGTYHIELLNGVDSAMFEDENFRIEFSYGGNINFELKNKLDTSLSVDWNDASIVMPDGSTEKIMHSGVKYIDRGASTPNTNVPPSAILKEVVVPIENVDFSGGLGWNNGVLFHYNMKSKRSLNGKEFSLFLPVILPSGRKDYTFRFQIQVYRVNRWTGKRITD